MEERLFTCSLTGVQRTATLIPMIFISLVLSAVIAMSVIAPLASGCAPNLFLLALMAAVGTLMVVFFWHVAGYAPTACSIAADGIRVLRRRRPPILFPADDLISLECVEHDAFYGCMRTSGVGGCFGSWGEFTCLKLGTFRGYLTSRSFVLVRTAKDGIIVLTPDAREQFVECAQQVLGLPRQP